MREGFGIRFGFSLDVARGARFPDSDPQVCRSRFGEVWGCLGVSGGFVMLRVFRT